MIAGAAASSREALPRLIKTSALTLIFLLYSIEEAAAADYGNGFSLRFFAKIFNVLFYCCSFTFVSKDRIDIGLLICEPEF